MSPMMLSLTLVTAVVVAVTLGGGGGGGGTMQWGVDATNNTLSSATAPQGSTVCCFLYPSPISDLGWTFNMNQARIKSAAALHSLLPDANITTRYVENFGKLSAEDRVTMLTEVLLNRSTELGGWACNIVFSNSISNFQNLSPSISTMAEENPDVLFVDHNGGQVYASGYPENLKFIGVDIWGLWFMAGAVAGAEFPEAESKLCMFVPFDGQNAGVNAFLAGMQFARSEAQLLVSKTFTFSNEELELNVAKQFVALGCRVVVRWADSRQSDLYVSTLNNATWSIGYASDTAAYVGDSVLTSVYFTMENYFHNTMLAYIQNTTVTSEIQLYASGALSLGTVSDQASHAARAMVDTATDWLLVNRSQLFCGDRRYLNGTRFIPASADGCVSIEEIVTTTFALQSEVHELASFKAPSTCVAGEYYTYDMSTLELTCTPCPANTHSLLDGAESCTECGEGQTSPIGATSCAFYNEGDFPIWAIVLIIVIIVFAFIGVIIIVFLTRGKPVYTPGAAPLGPEVTLCIVSLDLKHNNKWRQNFLPVVDSMSELVTKAASETKAYIVSSVGEVHLIAVDQPLVAYTFLEKVRVEAMAHNFPVTVSLRAAIHHGKPRIISRKNKKENSNSFDGEGGQVGKKNGEKDSVSSSTGTNSNANGSSSNTRIRYAGRELDIVRALFRTCADAGGIWCSAAALAKNPPPNAEFGPEVAIVAPGNNGTTTTSMIQLLGFSGGLGVSATAGDQSGANFSNLIFLDDRAKNEKEVDNNIIDIPNHSTGSEIGSSSVDGDETRDLALATLAMISPEEFEAAHDLTTEIIRSFIGLLPYKDGVHSLTTASRRLHLRDPNIPSNLPRKELGMRILRGPISAVSTQLLRQLEELELVMLMDRWHQASLAREAAVHEMDGGVADRTGSSTAASSSMLGSATNPPSEMGTSGGGQRLQLRGEDILSDQPPSNPMASTYQI